ncbi:MULTISPECIES: hypothetical protein [unclassified Paenibacillus]|uniref:hypothetical protein n=1 Tax=unclassified Paenibacillus TaxID=185978 RepID=UPI001AE6B767|nr:MULTISPECIES: hypothetical protein [unclassified Paenibacillus]MBP1156534.1 hypothetical protein [Paenibacillus sp. PvP091]MBP1172728.1 hypothetical protein [Paenibacillus sp. PvR098]MBP2439108.1 hypothetical protein [Paenibacillus sp. PvP052]
MEKHRKASQYRRYLAVVGTLNVNFLHLRKPWVVAWWSAAFPGFGHLQLGINIKGFILILWELLVNMLSRINESMVYAFNGQFELSKAVLNKRWLLMYIAVYVYAIWDSYRTTVELNKEYVLAAREGAPINPFQMNTIALNHLDKRSPWLSAVWSLLMPGLGQLHIHRIPIGFFVLGAWMIIAYYSHFMEVLLLTINGGLGNTVGMLDPQWLLFLPSMYCFSAYDAYTHAVESNQIYNRCQQQWLEKNYDGLQLDLSINRGRL